MGLATQARRSKTNDASGTTKFWVWDLSADGFAPPVAAFEQTFPSYQGSGGTIVSLFNAAPAWVKTQTPESSQNKVDIALQEICSAFGLTKDELKQICKVQSRKTLYNWIDGKSTPRRENMKRIFDILITARAWLDSGFAGNTAWLHQPVIDEKSVFDLLNENEVNKELIIFAGTRLYMQSPSKGPIADPVIEFSLARRIATTCTGSIHMRLIRQPG